MTGRSDAAQPRRQKKPIERREVFLYALAYRQTVDFLALGSGDQGVAKCFCVCEVGEACTLTGHETVSSSSVHPKRALAIHRQAVVRKNSVRAPHRRLGGLFDQVILVM